MTTYGSTMAERFAPGNFVTSDRRVGVTRAIKDEQDANPLVLVKWMDDLSQEWVRSEYLYLANCGGVPMSTRPDWAMDRAAQIMLIVLSPLRPTEQMKQIATLLELTRLEGATAQAQRDDEIVVGSIDAAMRRHAQAAE